MKHLLYFLLIFLLLSTSVSAKNFYVDPLNGSDTNSGTSINKAFQHLQAISLVDLRGGDSVLVAANGINKGSLVLKNKAGSKNRPIVISSFSANKSKATIDAKGYSSGILLENCSYITVNNLTIQADAGGMIDIADQDATMRCGVLVNTTQAGVSEGIVLKDLSIKDIYFEDPGFLRGENEVKTANGKQRYGWGIRFINNTDNASIKDITVAYCEIKNVSHTGIKFTAKNHGIENIKVYNNKVIETGGPGIQMSGVSKGHIYQNVVDGSGNNNDSRKWGRGSGLWTWGTKDVIIEHNEFLNANGPGDSAGAHIDFNCSDIIVQYNFSANNAGGFCEILGNNYNCAYRYNISVNDGYRVKGENGAFQEGKIFWLSGYVENKLKPLGPYNSYFYNNTIYTKPGLVAKVAVAKTAEGICMVNNIFVIEGESHEVEGDQFVADKRAEAVIPNVVFENNLFLNQKNWPQTVLVQPQNSVYGNPDYRNAGGLIPADYTPRNVGLIKDRGIDVSPIPGDSIGLRVGLKVTKDFFGHPIVNKPDMGAIEIEEQK